jgi:hypothetical protein
MHARTLFYLFDLRYFGSLDTDLLNVLSKAWQGSQARQDRDQELTEISTVTSETSVLEKGEGRTPGL